MAAVTKEYELFEADKAGHTPMDKQARQFPLGELVLWCFLGLVLYVAFIFLREYLVFSSNDSNLPVFVGAAQYTKLLMGNALFWKSLISPLLCIFLVEAAAFLLGSYRLIKSRAVCWIVKALGILLSVLCVIFRRDLLLEEGIFSFLSLWDGIVNRILFDVAPAVLAGMISLSLYTMAAPASTGPAKYGIKRVVLSFAGCIMPPLFLMLVIL